MAQYFEIHPENPQSRLIYQTIEIINQGGIIIYPTDSSYAIGCHLDDKQATDKIRRIRQLDQKHDFSLLCTDLSQVSQFTKVSNNAHRLIKTLTPGAFTFILDATKEVPKRLQHPKKKTIGVRIPNNLILQKLLQTLGEPLISTTMTLPQQNIALTDPYDIRSCLEREVDLIIDGGILNADKTTIINFADGDANIIRQGKGIATMLN